MFSTAQKTALVTYAKNATGLSKAIWAFANVEQETPPFVTMEILGIYDADGNRSETYKKHKWVSIRFNVFTTDGTHLRKCSELLDYADDDDHRLALGEADITFISALTDVTNATYLEGGVYRERAFMDIRFGVIFEQVDPELYIERVSGKILGHEFDVTNQED